MTRIKVLLTSRYEIDSYTQPIVDNLRKYCDVVCGVEAFWKSADFFDIVHLQWPEELFGWREITQKNLSDIEERLKSWIAKGSKLIITRHNELPHRQQELDIKLYSLFEKYCHGQIHMGNFSLMNLAYKNAENVFIEHPHNIHLDKGFDRMTVRNKYGIAPQKTVFLLFGKLRKFEEEDDIIRNFLKRRTSNDILYISHSAMITRIKSAAFFQRLKLRLRKIYLERKGIIIRNKIYDNIELNELMALSDVVVISRIHNLNSGILYLSYSFKKLVIAPAIGNIAEKLLKNPFFVPNDDGSILKAFLDAKALLKTNANLLNFQYVKTACDHEKIALDHYKFYQRVMQNKHGL